MTFQFSSVSDKQNPSALTLFSELINKILCPSLTAVNKREVVDENHTYQSRWTREHIFHLYCIHRFELHNLYYSANIVRVIKARRLRWAVHVARMGEGRGFTGFGWEARRKETNGKTKA